MIPDLIENLRSQTNETKIIRTGTKNAGAPRGIGSTQVEMKRTKKIKTKKRMTSIFPGESEILPAHTTTRGTTRKPQHKTEKNNDDGHTREKKTENMIQENMENGRTNKNDNSLRRIHIHGTKQFKEIKREKMEYKQKYPPYRNGGQHRRKEKNSNKMI